MVATVWEQPLSVATVWEQPLSVAIAKRRTHPPAVVMAAYGTITTAGVVMAPKAPCGPIRTWRKASVREFYSRDRSEAMSTTVNTAVILKNQNPKIP